ncbi:hypothetical protein [Nocardia sp. Marseille-Q1738]
MSREPWFHQYEAAAERAEQIEVEELPVHELALAAAATVWFQHIAEATDLGGEE